MAPRRVLEAGVRDGRGASTLGVGRRGEKRRENVVV
jgi:hypothetical protein